jgi:predicted Zn-dependent protease with MMP-like domain
MNRDQFRQRVDQALASIPADFRAAMSNIAIVIEDEPTAAQLDEVGVEPPDTLLGLYEGTPLTERPWAHGNALPDKITLFQGPILDSSDSDEDVIAAIGETLIHEIGHYFGLSEEAIEDIEEHYWRGESAEGDATQADETDDHGPDRDR